MGSLQASQWIKYFNSTCPSLGPPKAHEWGRSKFPQERNFSGSFRAKFPHGGLHLWSVSESVFSGLSTFRNQGAPSAIMKARNKAFSLIQITDDSRRHKHSTIPQLDTFTSLILGVSVSFLKPLFHQNMESNTIRPPFLFFGVLLDPRARSNKQSALEKHNFSRVPEKCNRCSKVCARQRILLLSANYFSWHGAWWRLLSPYPALYHLKSFSSSTTLSSRQCLSPTVAHNLKTGSYKWSVPSAYWISLGIR